MADLNTKPPVPSRGHWDGIYTRTAVEAVSWCQPHLETSSRLIQEHLDTDQTMIDIGAGRSTLVNDLLAPGYRDLTILDLSRVALGQASQRLGDCSAQVKCIAADVLTAELPQARFDLWHDRAVFPFLTEPDQQQTYAAQAARAITPRRLAAHRHLRP